MSKLTYCRFTKFIVNIKRMILRKGFLLTLLGVVLFIAIVIQLESKKAQITVERVPASEIR